MKKHRLVSLIALAAMLASCGGGGGGSTGAAAGGTASVTPTPTATPTPTGSGGTAPCSLRSRQDWALAQLNEWYLFPELLATNVDPGGFTNVSDYVDALTATARDQNKDRYFTYLTSIAEEDAYYDSGSSAGFGVRLVFDGSNRLFVTEAFEGAPAIAAGLDRGTEITAIGTSSGNLQTVAALVATGDPYAVSDALGDSTPGLTRVLRITNPQGTTRDVSVTKSDFALQPVSSRYGSLVIDDGGRKVGYINLRTFISTADQQLRDATATFRAQGITQIVVDLRYNGGGLVSTAELMTNLLGGNRSTGDVQNYITFRPSKSSENEVNYFAPQPQSASPTRIAFIGTGGTASASEFVINALIPYQHANEALVGSNTYGKPVGQIPLDLGACDDRLRVVAFATQNAARQGDYYNGLASKVEATCQANDDLTHAFGDPAEASLRQALDFLAGRQCTPIGASSSAALRERTITGGSTRLTRRLLSPGRPSTPQREVPGLY